MKKLLLNVILLSLTLVDSQKAVKRKSILDLAKESGVLNTFLFLIEQGGLSATFSKRGFIKYTIFAPSDKAFEALGGGAFLLSTPPEQIGQLIQYSMLLRNLPTRSFKNDQTYGTLLKGKRIRINKYDGFNTVNGIKFSQNDLKGSNGVVHILDTALTPPDGFILDLGKADPEFSTLVSLVEAAGLGSALGAPGAYTLFAPKNAAFTKKFGSAAEIEKLKSDKGALTKLLSRHVLPGTLFSVAVSSKSGKSRKTIDGQTVQTRVGGGMAKSSRRRKRRRRSSSMAAFQEDNSRRIEARVLEKDILAKNGVVHVIDSVL